MLHDSQIHRSAYVRKSSPDMPGSGLCVLASTNFHRLCSQNDPWHPWSHYSASASTFLICCSRNCSKYQKLFEGKRTPSATVNSALERNKSPVVFSYTDLRFMLSTEFSHEIVFELRLKTPVLSGGLKQTLDKPAGICCDENIHQDDLGVGQINSNLVIFKKRNYDRTLGGVTKTFGFRFDQADFSFKFWEVCAMKCI